MYYLLPMLMLASLVGQSFATVSCDGDLVINGCKRFAEQTGNSLQKTCQNPDGDPEYEFDCNVDLAVCVCPEGFKRLLPDGNECTDQCDTQAPDLTCPDVRKAAPSDDYRTRVAYEELTCTDDSNDISLVCQPESNAVFDIDPEGATVSCWCTDKYDNLADCSFTVEVFDETPPVAECPASMTVVAPPNDNSLSVTYEESPRCTDNSGAAIDPLCDPADGSVFSLGDAKEVTCSCTDAAGLEDSCKFTVTVVDETPPDAVCPASMTVAAPPNDNSLSVTYEESPRCTDNSGAAIPPLCDPADGSVFSLGDAKEVTCSCTDAAGLEDSCKFTVTVVDETPPVAECPASMTVAAPPNDNSLSVTYEESPSCTDNSGAAIDPLCDPADGSVFSLGDTQEVTCSCTDAAGLEDSCKFTVTVVDETPPDAVCPASMTVAAPPNDNSLSVTYEESPRCTDNSGAAIPPLCDPADGSVFSLGDAKEVTCSCTDAADLEDSCKFTVTVVDETPPDAVCPDSMTVAAPPTDNSLSVTYEEPPRCTDNSGAAIDPLCDPADGSVFSLGDAKEVTCSCTDAADLEDSCKFTVTVVDETPPDAVCPDSMTVEAPPTGNSLSVTYEESPRCTDNSGAAINPLCDPADGSEFSLGDTEVTCSCTDAADLEDSCKFTVTVTDNVAPTITCVNPDVKYVSSSIPYEAFVDWAQPTCVDNSEGQTVISCDEEPGNRPIGTYNVVCTCTDESGNSATCDITAVVDGQPIFDCEQEGEPTFQVNTDDPNDPVDVCFKLRLPEVGSYQITASANPIDGTPGEELYCDYSFDVENDV
ncbi:hyalin-like [Apostichopus japonicus]|uniref:hyalin-like n=1 Tax=Stichopus japonicus TaxID=307972 RepID=UPI003AB4AE79